MDVEFRWRTNQCQAELQRLDLEITVARAHIETLQQQITTLENRSSIMNEYQAQLEGQRMAEQQEITQTYKNARETAQQERKRQDLEKSAAPDSAEAIPS
ncbi:hypothetical protein CHU98_g2319 [Xylaria longipes]|nr:hypothetical protein CHU98_g2319 [Xylaria longipes]